ncbi:hypothetical protein IBTHAUMO2_170023 [Nitrosopumilaceae archaeon]|nr:hypothetical protein [Nitrosopumilus sp.]CAI9831088.1 hypothetical protein IBTHAUMO2_170023 [Nitrosopumilaceae archaeon]MDA7941180.1 hypothetical protein [Nitrosopumilus sp.]MDA7942422.1 hypothetical protein [Nitrosopumilus sp.]MDA7944857.1 hypothetical protein [Nitrosopumilus sp.]
MIGGAPGITTNRTSLAMAAVLAFPSLAAFLAIHAATGNVLLAAVPGFAVHFAALAFSGRIAAYLDSRLN